MGGKKGENKGNDRRGRPRAPTGDEQELWRNVMRDVEPIARNTPGPDTHPLQHGTAEDKPEPSPPPRKKMTAMPPQTPAPGREPPPRQPRMRPESGIDKRTLARLKKGKTPIDAVLDLHGMRQDEAHRRLVTFILSCWMSGRRVLLVITGKGTRSPEPGGVLRKQVPRWLHDDPLGEKVLTIQPAQPKDGGSGAYYVLLRRRRERDL